MAKRIAVIGGGAWGTALAAHAARHDHDVCLWAREPEVVSDVESKHENRLFLEGVPLPAKLRASSDMARALHGAEVVIVVPPSAHLRTVVAAAAPHLPKNVPIVIATKGIENGSLKLMADVAAETVDESCIAVLSGPSFAREVASGLPTDVVVASKNEAMAARVAEVMHAPTFRVYTSTDVVGVELGGALKNVLAIASGACDGLGMGTNARAALVTRGLAEMARLGAALGGQPLTFMGLSGAGDLILTATGPLSRNRALGMKVAEGVDPAKYVAAQRTVAEGFLTSKAAWQLAKAKGVDAPITEQVYYVLHEGRPLFDAMKQLLTRAQKHELWGF
jgi:glycerol-3-phosphate dehydrogenase (NAD(P)+)